MKKSLFLAAVLSLASLAIAGAKKYEITVSTPTKAGTAQLAPGTYKVQVQGDKVTFTDAKNKASVVTIKVTTGKFKFEATAVEATKKSGEDVIDAIDLGGTNTKVEFSY